MRYASMSIFICLGTIIGTSALAQDCGQVLQHGIWESRDASSGTVQSSSFANWACSSGSSKLGGSYLGEYGDFKFNKDDDSSSCSSSNGSWKIDQQQTEKTRTAAAALAEAWTRCIDSLGTHAGVLYRDDMSYFTIQLSAHGVQNNEGRAILKPLDPSKLTCKVDFGTEIKFNISKTISCSRSTNDPVSIDVEYPDGYGGQTLYIRGFKPPVVPPPRPTIVSVEVPINSSDGDSFPLRANKWRATFPAPLTQGIAFILDPNEFQLVPPQFAIHDHHMVAGEPRRPEPTRANVTYVFDRPAEIAGIEMVQHQNGINGIEGFYGESTSALIPMGKHGVLW